MELQIRLLGPVELFVDDRNVTPGAAKRRALLAGLALAANHPVSLDRLAGMVWADTPPTSAVANLRSYAAGLRRTLGNRLVARQCGYELRLAPHELDVGEFQRLAGRGRALAAADPVGAIDTLTVALGQWRGASGDGLPRGTELENRWASLDEQRLQVFEELTGARLAVGHHGDLLAPLREHLAAHPLRERAWGQLMLALYRCGDVPAALAVYQGARAVLNEQLGIEPGAELARLHRAMLDRAPELSYARQPRSGPTSRTEEQTAGTPRWTVPHELPADLVAFAGRGAETSAVVAAVTGAVPAAVVVTGPAGSGKTALAVRAAHRAADSFPDGQIFVDLGYRTAVTPGEVLARVLRAMGVAPAEVPDGVDERAGRFRSLAAGRRLLLVVDGVARAAQVRPLLPATPGPALIVVALGGLGALEVAQRVSLTPLPAAGAWHLLAVLAGEDRLTADPTATAALIGLCAGSVLALRVVGSRLARWPAMPVATLVGQLHDGRDRLDLLAYEDLSLRASLARTVAAVRAEDAVAGPLLQVLGAAPDAPIVVEPAAAQLGASAQRVRRALDHLADAYLIQRDGPDGYRLPALVRDYAAELAAQTPRLIPLAGVTPPRPLTVR